MLPSGNDAALVIANYLGSFFKKEEGQLKSKKI